RVLFRSSVKPARLVRSKPALSWCRRRAFAHLPPTKRESETRIGVVRLSSEVVEIQPNRPRNTKGRRSPMAAKAIPRMEEGLGSYLRNLGGHKQLTREEEYELSRVVKKGGAAAEAARTRLARSNLPFVV